jgi:hypothetical protein
MIFPRRRSTCVAVPGSIRRFSPDGQYLAIFGHDQVTLFLFVIIPNAISQRRFEDFFTLKKTFKLAMDNENSLLCKDFLLFSGEFLILASAAPSKDTRKKSRLNNQRSLTAFENLDDVCFHLVRISDMTVSDRIEMNNDYVLLANQCGVSLLDDLFLVTSLQHQCVVVYKIIEGKFVAITRIGHHLGLSRLHPTEGQFISGLWHKILCFCYQKNDNKAWFHGVSSALNNLAIAKCQFIDSDTLLFKFVSKDFLSQRFLPF